MTNATEQDLINIKEIEDFLNTEGVEYTKREDRFDLMINNVDGTQGVWTLYHPVWSYTGENGQVTEVRYINSASHRIDCSKKWGKDYYGIPQNFFSKLSKEKEDEGIRTIFIKDYEIAEGQDVEEPDGTITKNYRRKWEVIKSTMLTAAAKIKIRIFARDCEVRIVPSQKKRKGDFNQLRWFLEKNCLYGYRPAAVNLGLYLKKDKAGFKKGDLLMVETYGSGFYSNKNHKEDPIVEVIRASTKTYAQVVGGASKLLKYFLKNYPTIEFNKKTYPVNKVLFYVDVCHSFAKSMSALGYKFDGWDTRGGGFHNFAVEEINEDGLYVPKGRMYQRMPMKHKLIMKLMKEHKSISIPHAGTKVFSIDREEWLKENS